MSSLYLRGNVWWYRFTPPSSGKQIRTSTGTSDKRQAQEMLDKAKAEAWRVARLGEKPDRTWMEAAARWIEEKSAKRSISDDAGKLIILNSVMRTVKLSQVDNDFVRENVIRGVLAARCVTPATVNRYVTLIKSIMNAAWKEWGWVDQVPHFSKPGTSGERKRFAWLTPEQFLRLRSGLPPHTAALATLAVVTGLREDNLIRLRWNQVDLIRRYIFVPAAEFKGKRDHYVPLCDTGVAVIRAQLGKHYERVFTYKGSPFDSINLRHWHRVVEEKGILGELRRDGLLKADLKGKPEKFVFHGLRHTFATWLGRAGVPELTIYRMAGWKNGQAGVGMSYTHLEDIDYLLPHAKKIDEVLNGNIAICGTSTNLAQDRLTKLAQMA